jgi:hypothetical protein
MGNSPDVIDEVGMTEASYTDINSLINLSVKATSAATSVYMICACGAFCPALRILGARWNFLLALRIRMLATMAMNL